MGLQEKRWIEDGKNNWIPKRQKSLKERVGADVTFDARWESFDLPALQNVENQGFVSVENALATIGRDSVGKEAVAGIKKVILENVTDVSKMGVALKDGVLEYRAAWGQSKYLSESDLKNQIESFL
jgi:hypothetical protein